MRSAAPRVGDEDHPVGVDVDALLPAARADRGHQGAEVRHAPASRAACPRRGGRSPSGPRRGRGALDVLHEELGRPAGLGGHLLDVIARSEASFTIAVSGVRSSCATSAVNRRSRACASERAVILPSSASAISLKDAAQSPNSSSSLPGGACRGLRRAVGRRAARATGRAPPSQERPCGPATTTTIPSPPGGCSAAERCRPRALPRRRRSRPRRPRLPERGRRSRGSACPRPRCARRPAGRRRRSAQDPQGICSSPRERLEE